MYNGIGMSSLRGAGTSGHVRRNAAKERPSHVRPRGPVGPSASATAHARLAKIGGAAVQAHERARRIEVEVAAREYKLIADGASRKEAEREAGKVREEIEGPGREVEVVAKEAGGIEVRIGKSGGAGRMRDAFGIRKDYQEGASFRRMRKGSENTGDAVLGAAAVDVSVVEPDGEKDKPGLVGYGATSDSSSSLSPSSSSPISARSHSRSRSRSLSPLPIPGPPPRRLKTPGRYLGSQRDPSRSPSSYHFPAGRDSDVPSNWRVRDDTRARSPSPRAAPQSFLPRESSHSLSPARRRSFSPSRRHSLSPARYRGRSPAPLSEPSPARRRLPSPPRQRSLSPVRQRDPLPLRRRALSPYSRPLSVSPRGEGPGERERSRRSRSHSLQNEPSVYGEGNMQSFDKGYPRESRAVRDSSYGVGRRDSWRDRSDSARGNVHPRGEWGAPPPDSVTRAIEMQADVTNDTGDARHLDARERDIRRSSPQDGFFAKGPRSERCSPAPLPDPRRQMSSNHDRHDRSRTQYRRGSLSRSPPRLRSPQRDGYGLYPARDTPGGQNNSRWRRSRFKSRSPDQYRSYPDQALTTGRYGHGNTGRISPQRRENRFDRSPRMPPAHHDSSPRHNRRAEVHPDRGGPSGFVQQSRPDCSLSPYPRRLARSRSRSLSRSRQRSQSPASGLSPVLSRSISPSNFRPASVSLDADSRREHFPVYDRRSISRSVSPSREEVEAEMAELGEEPRRMHGRAQSPAAARSPAVARSPAASLSPPTASLPFGSPARQRQEKLDRLRQNAARGFRKGCERAKSPARKGSPDGHRLAQLKAVAGESMRQRPAKLKGYAESASGAPLGKEMHEIPSAARRSSSPSPHQSNELQESRLTAMKKAALEKSTLKESSLKAGSRPDGGSDVGILLTPPSVNQRADLSPEEILNGDSQRILESSSDGSMAMHLASAAGLNDSHVNSSTVAGLLPEGDSEILAEYHVAKPCPDDSTLMKFKEGTSLAEKASGGIAEGLVVKKLRTHKSRFSSAASAAKDRRPASKKKAESPTSSAAIAEAVDQLPELSVDAPTGTDSCARDNNSAVDDGKEVGAGSKTRFVDRAGLGSSAVDASAGEKESKVIGESPSMAMATVSKELSAVQPTSFINQFGAGPTRKSLKVSGDENSNVETLEPGKSGSSKQQSDAAQADRYFGDDRDQSLEAKEPHVLKKRSAAVVMGLSKSEKTVTESDQALDIKEPRASRKRPAADVKDESKCKQTELERDQSLEAKEPRLWRKHPVLDAKKGSKSEKAMAENDQSLEAMKARASNMRLAPDVEGEIKCKKTKVETEQTEQCLESKKPRLLRNRPVADVKDKSKSEKTEAENDQSLEAIKPRVPKKRSAADVTNESKFESEDSKLVKTPKTAITGEDADVHLELKASPQQQPPKARTAAVTDKAAEDKRDQKVNITDKLRSSRDQSAVDENISEGLEAEASAEAEDPAPYQVKAKVETGSGSEKIGKGEKSRSKMSFSKRVEGEIKGGEGDHSRVDSGGVDDISVEVKVSTRRSGISRSVESGKGRDWEKRRIDARKSGKAKSADAKVASNEPEVPISKAPGRSAGAKDSAEKEARDDEEDEKRVAGDDDAIVENEAAGREKKGRKSRISDGVQKLENDAQVEKKKSRASKTRSADVKEVDGGDDGASEGVQNLKDDDAHAEKKKSRSSRKRSAIVKEESEDGGAADGVQKLEDDSQAEKKNSRSSRKRSAALTEEDGKGAAAVEDSRKSKKRRSSTKRKSSTASGDGNGFLEAAGDKSKSSRSWGRKSGAGSGTTKSGVPREGGKRGSSSTKDEEGSALDAVDERTTKRRRTRTEK